MYKFVGFLTVVRTKNLIMTITIFLTEKQILVHSYRLEIYPFRISGNVILKSIFLLQPTDIFIVIEA